MSDETGHPRRTRAGEIGEILQDLKSLGRHGSLTPLEGSFSAMGMLILDSILSGDAPALAYARDGLRELIALRDRGELILGPEEYGRTRSLLVGAMSGLARVAPPKSSRRKIEDLPGI